MPMPLTVWITINYGKFWKKWEYQTTWPASWEICMQVRKQQLELDKEKQTGSKSGKEYVKAICCHSGSWWWTRRPGVLQSMGAQWVGHDWVTELNWAELSWIWTKSIWMFFKLHRIKNLKTSISRKIILVTSPKSFFFFFHLFLLHVNVLNCCFWTVVLEKTLQIPLDCKEIQPVHPKGDQSWIFIGRTDAEAETPIFWPPHVKNWLIGKGPDAEKRLKVGGEGDNTGWDGWMASLTQWTWVWVNSRSWSWTGRPGVLRFLGSQRVGQDWATELNWTHLSHR